MDRERRSTTDSTTVRRDESRAQQTDAELATTEDDADTPTVSTIAAKPPRAPSALPEELESGTRIGRYTVLGPLGKGGMGVVVKAYDPELDRQVALKLIRPDTQAEARAVSRLSREAQALAKLSHPNVVHVFDVGEDRGTVFVAMELVEGMNVRRWLAKGRRSRREILAVFAEAGRGLAAAHRAGLIHRDFNPSNVLVGDDGRVRVLDFGLARTSLREHTDSDDAVTRPPSRQQAATDEPTPAADSHSSDGLLDAPLTKVGTVVGTPGYMAPEQARGEEVDARTDQFSFCVSLYRALCGTLPFPHKTPSASRPLEHGQKPLPPPPQSRVPAWLRRLLVRGLSVDPAARFASMDELLTALARGERRPRRVAMAGASALAIVVVGGLFALRSGADSSQALCTSGSQEVARIWNEDSRARLRRSFAATERANVAKAWRRTASLIDEYAARWATARDRSCADTRIRGTQSEKLLDRSMTCLDRRLYELRSTVDVLTGLATDAPERAVEVAAALTPVERCLDRDALRLGVDVAEDPALRAQLEEIWPLLDESLVLSRAGRARDSLEVARQAAARAEKLDYPPVLAEALYRVGFVQNEVEGFAPARATVERAYMTAVTAGNDELAAWSAMQMCYLLGYGGGDPALVDLWTGIASSYRFRVQDRSGFASRLAQHRATVAGNRGDYDAALRELEEALRIAEEDPNATPTDVSDQLTHLGNEYTNRGDFKRALELNGRAIAIAEKVLGPEHELVGKYLINQARALHSAGRFADALAAARRSQRILEASMGPDNPLVAMPLLSEARALRALARSDEAVDPIARAIELYERDPGPDGSWLAEALVIGAEVAAETGNWERAGELAARTVAMAEEVGDSSRWWPVAYVVEAAVALRIPQDCPRTTAWLTALHTRIDDDPKWDYELANSLALVGRCELAQGHVRKAEKLAASAAEHQKRAGLVDSTVLPELQFGLARALFHAQRKRAVAYAVDAFHSCERLDHPVAKAVADDIASWLEKHGVERPPPEPPVAVQPPP